LPIAPLAKFSSWTAAANAVALVPWSSFPGGSASGACARASRSARDSSFSKATPERRAASARLCPAVTAPKEPRSTPRRFATSPASARAIRISVPGGRQPQIGVGRSHAEAGADVGGKALARATRDRVAELVLHRIQPGLQEVRTEGDDQVGTAQLELRDRVDAEEARVRAAKRFVGEQLEAQALR